MVNTRRNVWELGDDWAAPILWYARGVAAMQKRPIKDPGSWRFWGAIHGFDRGLWQQLGELGAGETLPASADMRTYWSQCQHGTWYFLPWHRGYLLAFEAMVRDAVKSLGGPADWALPYWNYFKPNQNTLPAAFSSPDWPDGKGNNPLHVAQRYGPHNDGKVVLPIAELNLNALADRVFTGAASGGTPGLGGPATGFSHGGNAHGGLESQPHDIVHVLVGGGDNATRLPGLMSDPDTAALDPIFWLHHANIDRLWQAWIASGNGHANPSASKWLKGPGVLGGHSFVLPQPGGGKWTYLPADMVDLAKLGYGYDDVAHPATVAPAGARLQALGAPAGAGAAPAGSPTMEHATELLGASAQGIALQGNGASAELSLDSAVRGRVAASLAAVRGAPTAEPDRVFLNLENVRGQNDAVSFRVYVDLPGDPGDAAGAGQLAGSIALFGVRKASQADGEHAGNGVTHVLDITALIDALHLAGRLDTSKLRVRLVPYAPVPDGAQVSIGRISVFREHAVPGK